MNMSDIILKKKRGGSLSQEEISFFIHEYVAGNIPDYQASALLMAICFVGMNEKETVDLTLAMAHSGDMVDLSPIRGKKVDKHSTGGVGDKTTLICAPIVAACNVKVAKMSGRGLGHTGGTIDKLESIPGFQTVLSKEKFFQTVDNCGLSLIGQSGNLAPADKKLYALRDVTATVDSIPLIASSIMSKKIAAGADSILLDVKIGSGAFMKTLDDAIRLAQTMVSIGEMARRRTLAIITNMDIPLGYAIGNSLEVIEAMDVLKGIGPKDLTEVSLALAANMLYVSDISSKKLCYEMAKNTLLDGSAFDTFCQMVRLQGGDDASLRDYSLLKQAKYSFELRAEKDGFITEMNAENIGSAAVLLGAGRKTKESIIDSSAGILLHKKYGDKIIKGDCLAVLYTDKQEALLECEDILREAITIDGSPPEKQKLIYACVDKDRVEKY